MKDFVMRLGLFESWIHPPSLVAAIFAVRRQLRRTGARREPVLGGGACEVPPPTLLMMLNVLSDLEVLNETVEGA